MALTIAQRIGLGCDFLIRIRNGDNGVPAVAPGNGSGCWTSSEALDSLVHSPVRPTGFDDIVAGLVRFLMDAQLTTRGQEGGLPLVAGGRQTSTMATAHFVLSVGFAARYLDDELRTDALAARERAKAWLIKNQGSDNGGWGLEPRSGPAGKASRVVSTFIAQRALAADGSTVDDSQPLRSGADYLWNLYDGSGFPAYAGQPADPCSTARAYWALLDSGAIGERPDFEAKTIDFIVSALPADGLWQLDTESYVPDKTSGEIVFNSNTTAELLEFFCQTGARPDLRMRLAEWFNSNQRDDGSWPLGANDNLKTDILTWSTNEAIHALTSFLHSLCATELFVTDGNPGAELTDGGTVNGANEVDDSHSDTPRLRRGRLLIPYMIIAVQSVILGVLLLRSRFQASWDALPDDFRSTFWWGAGIALAINILAAAIVIGGTYVARKLSERHGEEPDGQ